MQSRDLGLVDISHAYGKRSQGFALDSVSFTVPQGEFWTLLGPSGSGKSTLLRIIGGYIRPDRGRVLIDGSDITAVRPQDRDIGMVFQDYALFPHMTVFDNVAYGLRARRLDRTEIRTRVGNMLELNRLIGFERRYPHQLSGGQQQRVALARALVIQPCVLLMDEALGALDLKLRESMAIEVKKLQRELATTTIHVTHDQSEAMTMSDRIVVMRAGRIEQIGTPLELSLRPAKRFVGEFVGTNNVLPVEIESRDADAVLGTIAGIDGQVALCKFDACGSLLDSKQFLIISAEKTTVSATPHARGLPGVIRATKYFGTSRYFVIESRSGLIVSALASLGSFGVGDRVYATWAIEDARLVPDSESEAASPATTVALPRP